MSGQNIGCSLAEAAESEQYMSYLTEAAGTPRSMHVVYINTSLRTKAQADALVPTITCTSSNVVQTILQGFAQVHRKCLDVEQRSEPTEAFLGVGLYDGREV
jgi:quinolinate synthase